MWVGPGVALRIMVTHMLWGTCGRLQKGHPTEWITCMEVQKGTYGHQETPGEESTVKIVERKITGSRAKMVMGEARM